MPERESRKLKLPHIIGERKKKIRVAPPPKEYRLHEWSDYTKKPDLDVSLYISEETMKKIQQHAMELAKPNKEAMGLMIGDIYSWDGKIHGLVRNVVSTDLDTTAVSVKFERKAFEGLFEQLEKIRYSYVIIGWYHSHPGHTCFMSGTDIETQKTMFSKPHQHAVVIDPINKEVKSYKLKGDKCVEEPFAIYSRKTTPAYRASKEVLFVSIMCILLGTILLYYGLFLIYQSAFWRALSCSFSIIFFAFGIYSSLVFYQVSATV